MRALVVYESMFGNTEAVARAVAAGLRTRYEVELSPVTEAAGRPAPEVDLLVVGGPTHAFGLSRPATRKDAASRVPGPVPAELGVRDWLDAAFPVSPPRAAAAFGTKMTEPRWLPGSAAKGIAKRLRRLGYRLAGAPADFHVDGMTGPVTAGELDRASAWGAELAAAAHPAAR
ncbi:flavodoxin family protein [Nocardia rhizosphaerae]|uniref:Flavodoxin family protein n=1 Tax=Nocardia rhizosphaerae TaxID=1691571 RepID=A0ABV8LDM4_9NOCA